MKKIQHFGFLALIVFISCQDKEAEAYAVEMVDTTAAAVTEDFAAVAVPPPPPAKIDYSKKITQKIIKNAVLRFETQDLDKTYTSIIENCKKTKAIIQNDAENNNNYQVSRNITIRIPSENFDVFLVELSKGVSYFERKEISSKDVTAEYIDHESRIASKTKLENRYLELLKKANKVEEMLEIEKQLSAIREEIEAKQGQLKYLQNQVSMSTVEVEFFKNTPAAEGARVSFGTKIWNAIVSGFNGIANFFINLIAIWPFILILVAIIYLIRKRFIRKKQA